jgi:anti-sigma B factor antagonist
VIDDLIGVEIEQRDDVVVARLSGELDISVAEKTGRKIADAVPSSALGVVVDMSGLEFMDSSGVSMLFSLARQVGSHRQQLRVVAPPGRPVSRVLQIVEFDRAAPVDVDVGSAVSELATRRTSRPPRG